MVQVIAYMILEVNGRLLSRVCLCAMLASFACGLCAVLLLWDTPYTNYNFGQSEFFAIPYISLQSKMPAKRH